MWRPNGLYELQEDKWSEKASMERFPATKKAVFSTACEVPLLPRVLS